MEDTTERSNLKGAAVEDSPRSWPLGYLLRALSRAGTHTPPETGSGRLPWWSGTHTRTTGASAASAHHQGAPEHHQEHHLSETFWDVRLRSVALTIRKD